MARLDLYDIQGNIVKGYGRFGFPFARYVFFGFSDENAGRNFVSKIIPLVTTAEPWENFFEKQDKLTLPKATTNIAFSYQGLKKLGVPRISLQSFPDDFSMGMKERCDILGDDDASAPENWDKIWRDNEVHCWISINGVSEKEIETRYQQIMKFVEENNKGVKLLSGHRGDDGKQNLDYQSAAAVFHDNKPSAREHFGFVDGISDPFFKGTQTSPYYVVHNVVCQSHGRDK